MQPALVLGTSRSTGFHSTYSSLKPMSMRYLVFLLRYFTERAFSPYYSGIRGNFCCRHHHVEMCVICFIDSLFANKASHYPNTPPPCESGQKFPKNLQTNGPLKKSKGRRDVFLFLLCSVFLVFCSYRPWPSLLPSAEPGSGTAGVIGADKAIRCSEVPS